VFDGVKPAGLGIGLIAAALATWTSRLLIPAWPWRVRIIPLLSLAAHFVWSSIVAAVEVARMAFRPRLALQPGFVTCPCGIPAGPARDFFLSMVSLMPGSAPVGEEGANGIVMHCLDVTQPVAAQMADNEKRFRQACELVEARP
jgi:multicomponent Na+:H+ antiporter subunit E